MNKIIVLIRTNGFKFRTKRIAGVPQYIELKGELFKLDNERESTAEYKQIIPTQLHPLDLE